MKSVSARQEEKEEEEEEKEEEEEEEEEENSPLDRTRVLRDEGRKERDFLL